MVFGVLRFIREGQVVSLRSSAGLPDNLATKVKNKFHARIEQGKRCEPQDVERFMYDIFKAARNAPEEQDRIRALIKENSKDGMLDLTDIFWVVRLYGDKQAEDVWKREQDAQQKAGFSSAQVAQYRKYFVEADADGSGYLAADEIQEIFDEVLAPTLAQVQSLRREIHDMGEDNDCIDFPEFLRLMRVVSA